MIHSTTFNKLLSNAYSFPSMLLSLRKNARNATGRMEHLKDLLRRLLGREKLTPLIRVTADGRTKVNARLLFQTGKVRETMLTIHRINLK